jgi:large subunit ribosomal protein L9
LPQGKALRANASNIKSFEVKKSQMEATNLETKKEAEVVGATLDGQVFIVIRSASDAGALYGSVTTRDAAEAATDAGFTVNRGQIVLDRPIKDLGMHTVSVVLHPEVIVKVKLNVARSIEESALQAAGKSIQELAAEAEAEAEFEIANLFDEMGAAQDGMDLGRD